MTFCHVYRVYMNEQGRLNGYSFILKSVDILRIDGFDSARNYVKVE